jgi:hypothetical protein
MIGLDGNHHMVPVVGSQNDHCMILDIDHRGLDRLVVENQAGMELRIQHKFAGCKIQADADLILAPSSVAQQTFS